MAHRSPTPHSFPIDQGNAGTTSQSTNRKNRLAVGDVTSFDSVQIDADQLLGANRVVEPGQRLILGNNRRGHVGRRACPLQVQREGLLGGNYQRLFELEECISNGLTIR